MDKYIGFKMIEAEPCTVEEFNKIRPLHYSGECQDGYKVVYQDGYVSWSPKEVFEGAYRVQNGLTFGLAIETLKAGKKVARNGWNGKGMYIQLHKGTDFEHAIIEPFLVIKNVKNSFNTWVPSISDLLAEDWEVV